MAIRRISIKHLIYALSKIGLESDYVDMGYNPEHGLILVPSELELPDKREEEQSPKPEIKTDIKIDPNTSLDDLLG